MSQARRSVRPQDESHFGLIVPLQVSGRDQKFECFLVKKYHAPRRDDMSQRRGIGLPTSPILVLHLQNCIFLMLESIQMFSPL